MIDVRIIEQYYTKTFNQFEQKSSNNITIIYDLSIFKDMGPNLFTKNLYSKFHPEVTNLDDFIKEDDEIISCYYSVLLNFAKIKNQANISKIELDNERTIRFIPIQNNYWLSFTYDNDTGYNFFIEKTIDKIIKKAIPIINSHEELFKIHSLTGRKSVSNHHQDDFEKLGNELTVLFDLGYNNKKVLRYLNNLKKKSKGIDNYISLKAKETYNKITEIIKMNPLKEKELLNLIDTEL